MQSGQLVESNQEKFGKFLSLNFASRRKLCKISVFYEKINTVAFISCGKVFIFLRFGSFLFRKCITLTSLSDIGILRDSVSDLKISIRSAAVNIFNWLARKKCFAWEYAQEVGGGLATG